MYGVVKTTCSVPRGLAVAVNGHTGFRSSYRYSQPERWPVHGSGDQVLRDAHVAFSATVDMEARSRILHLPDQTQQFGTHSEAAPISKMVPMVSLAGCARTSIEECPTGEIGCSQRAHRGYQAGVRPWI
jgi:hypothetical protein